MTDFTIIEAPSNLGLKPDSVEHLADALLDAGLARRLDARRHARLAVPPYDARRDYFKLRRFRPDFGREFNATNYWADKMQRNEVKR